MTLYCPKCGTYPQNSGGVCLCQQQIHYVDNIGNEIGVNKALSELVSENTRLRARNEALEAKVARLRKALEEVAVWSEQLNSECLADHSLAMLQWRGCVAIAKAALEDSDG